MSLISLGIRNVRNLQSVDVDPTPHMNLIFGPNASGKTSMLEALYFLSRARSFRTSRFERLVREGEERITVLGSLKTDRGALPIGVERTRQTLRMRLAGSDLVTISELVAAVPTQVIHPNSHKLLEEGPRYRRRFLDWGVFHVEPTFFPAWNRFQKALSQRNAALRSGRNTRLVTAWDPELIEAAEIIHATRTRYVAALEATLASDARSLIDDLDVHLDYLPGWPAGHAYGDALAASLPQDLSQGFTSRGPHRANIGFRVGRVPAAERVSRGQQKILVAALLLSQAGLFTRVTGKSCILLMDDIAAELDQAHRDRLMAFVSQLNLQIFLTAIEPEALCDRYEGDTRMFHVEHGSVREVV